MKQGAKVCVLCVNLFWLRLFDGSGAAERKRLRVILGLKSKTFPQASRYPRSGHKSRET